MSRNEFLLYRAHKKASRMKQIYGLKPPPGVEALLEREQTALNIRESFRLSVYILFRSPAHRLKLIWRHLTDQDTPKRRNRIDRLAQDLRSHLSDPCRIMANFFERNNYSKDLARVPPLMEKMLFRTTPLLVVQPQNESQGSVHRHAPRQPAIVRSRTCV